MFVFPGTLPDLTHKLTRDAAERVAGNWWKLLLNGALLIVAGVLIFSVNWDVRSLATFIGALFIVEGAMMSLTAGIDARVTRGNVISGLLSIATGIAIIVWPSPGLLVVAIFLGAWLIVVGTVTISGAFAARKLISNWWLLLITGLLEVPLGVLALADPGATLAALVTVGGIWAARRCVRPGTPGLQVGPAIPAPSGEHRRGVRSICRMRARDRGCGGMPAAGTHRRRPRGLRHSGRRVPVRRAGHYRPDDQRSDAPDDASSGAQDREGEPGTGHDRNRARREPRR